MFWDKKDTTLVDKLKEQEEKIDSQNVTIGELTNKLDSIVSEFNQYRNDSNDRFRKLNNLVDEKLDAQKEDTETLLIRLEKNFENKINSISDDKPLITDLLRKIAALEGIKDAIEHRRSVEEVQGMLKVLEGAMLKDECEERDVSIKKEKIRILRWVLGESI